MTVLDWARYITAWIEAISGTAKAILNGIKNIEFPDRDDYRSKPDVVADTKPENQSTETNQEPINIASFHQDKSENSAEGAVKAS